MLNPNKKKPLPKSQTEIGALGEKLVALDLKKKGYSVKVDTKGTGKTDIEASKNGKIAALIQVKTGVEPNTPADLPGEEVAAIKRRAGQLSCAALEANVQLDENYAQKGAVKYRKL
jgi:Holliday junction resolvase-like predicted endonuclease